MLYQAQDLRVEEEEEGEREERKQENLTRYSSSEVEKEDSRGEAEAGMVCILAWERVCRKSRQHKKRRIVREGEEVEGEAIGNCRVGE